MVLSTLRETIALPPIGKVVLARVRFVRNWPLCLGGKKVTHKAMRVKRIKTKDTARGWQWSGEGSASSINGEVIYFLNR